MNELNTRAPRHLWIVGVLAVLWNAVGAFDYSASQLRLDFYMSEFTPDQLAYFYAFPAWAIAAAVRDRSGLTGSASSTSGRPAVRRRRKSMRLSPLKPMVRAAASASCALTRRRPCSREQAMGARPTSSSASDGYLFTVTL